MIYSNIKELIQFKSRAGSLRRPAIISSRIFALIMFILALAGPQFGATYETIHQKGIDIILCLDTSGSMRAVDFKIESDPVQRLEVVKKLAADFIKTRVNDRIGIVVFGKEAVTLCPLTVDFATLLRFLDNIQIGMAGDMTALGSALAVGVKRLGNSSERSRIIILLTDGISNSGALAPEEAAAIARVFGIKVYTIGVGTDKIVSFETDTPFGKTTVLKAAHLDEETLKKIALTTGGLFFKASDSAGLKEIFDSIAKLEKNRFELKSYTGFREGFIPFVITGLAVFILTEILTHTLFLKIP